MAVTIHRGRKPYTLIWRVNMGDGRRQHESNEFYLEGYRWHLLLQTEINAHHGEEDWKMYMRKIHPNDEIHTFLISIYIEDRKKNLECLNFSRIIVDKSGIEQILWRRKSNVLFKFPDVALDGNVTFLMMLLADYSSIAKLESYTGHKIVQTPSYLDVRPCLGSLKMDIQKLLADSSETDVELRCSGHKLRAHRAILIARSDVFAAMLQNDMLEKNKGFIEIADTEFSILEHFIRYLYSGTLPELTIDLASKLYETSDKYAVKALMVRCSSFLKEHLTEENACSLLVLADSHSDKDLKDFVIFYIIRKDILIRMYEENAFQDCHPKLVVDVFYRAYKIAKASMKK